MVLPTSKVARRELANRAYGIDKAMARCGVVTEEGYRSGKLFCPFGAIFHSDGGDSAALRTYPDTDTAYCFACAKYFTPAILIAQYEDITEDEAVEVMLMEIGYVESEEDFSFEDEEENPQADKSAFTQAFQMFVARKIPDYGTRQYEPDVSAWVSRCLSLLDSVATLEGAELWLATVKKATLKKFGKEKDNGNQVGADEA